MNEDLRRKPRLAVCCRAVVHDRHGVWTGVTADVSATGCRIISRRLLRAGSQLIVTLSSDLVTDELDVLGEAVWATREHLAVSFGRPVRSGGLTPAQWLERVLDAGVDSAAHPPTGPGPGVRPLPPVSLRRPTPRPRGRAPADGVEAKRERRRV
jgi:hypothetical protein